MQQADFQRFRAVMTGMAKVYEREIDGALLDAYWLALRDWSLADFEAAAAHLMRTSKFMPRPADFHELREAGRPTAAEAWLKAVEASAGAISCGRVMTVRTCGDPLIDRAVRAIGGYGAIAMCDEDKLHFLERRFAEHYESIQDAEEVRAALPQLTGSDAVSHSSTFRVTGPRSAKDILGRIAHAHNGAAERTRETQ
jgi:hypothetical protein